MGAIITGFFVAGVETTSTIIVFPIYVRIAIMVISLVIALLGSLFAIRRITSLEPGQVFRG